MSRSRVLVLAVLAITVVGMPLLTGCGATPTPTAVAPTAVSTTAATAAAPTQPPATKAPTSAPTAVPATPTKGPAVGGTLHRIQSVEPDSLDPTVALGGSKSYQLLSLLGATLITRDPSGSGFAPWLAESWKASSDGLTWEFKLRKGIKFSDGAPLTAADFVFTYNRAKDPATMSKGAGTYVAMVEEFVAVDDLTLQMKLKQPYYPLLANFCLYLLAPTEKAAVERMGGGEYGRNPVSLGAYKLKEWQTGIKVVLERNPDYTWAPSFLHQGPAYIQTVEFLIVTEAATQIAGIEAGELDYGSVSVKDLRRFEDKTKYQILTSYAAGCTPDINLNVSKPPFDDVKVRQAFNMAIDREAIIKVVALGHGIPQYGPLSQVVMGYSAEAEKLGASLYKFDLAKAKDLMKQAGYVYGADGMLTKDGKPFQLTLKVWASEDTVKVCEMVQEQLKALGVGIEINQSEFGIHVKDVFGGNYEIAGFGDGSDEADLMFLMHHSSQIGGRNTSQNTNPELDKLLLATRTATDAAQRQAACDAAAKYLVENAINIPLYASESNYVVNARVKGIVFGVKTNWVWFHDAYIESK